MRKKGPPPEVETFIVGPSCCGSFSTGKDLCHQCIAKGLYKSAICFTPPALSKNGADHEEDFLQLFDNGAKT
ncbi:MAG: hypothetical protein IKA93_01405 [Elusimicrobiaceae bacterium]|nr:hypothetical protein [Elusimicrobiaceae bacterium]MBR2505237.1 hypothetical protein [Elusimicrobiaceae bacterium]